MIRNVVLRCKITQCLSQINALVSLVSILLMENESHVPRVKTCQAAASHVTVYNVSVGDQPLLIPCTITRHHYRQHYAQRNAPVFKLLSGRF